MGLDRVQISDRLALRYEPGQFSFRHFDAAASNEDLYELAQYLNSLQTDEVKRVVRVQTYQFM